MPTLLVVDDEQSICWGLRRIGEQLGCDVITASSAEQALPLAARQHPDAIILDVRLPGMDGLTAIERFRQDLGAVPIIVITAYGDLQTAVRAVRLGAFEYVVKPFDAGKIQQVLQRALAAPNLASSTRISAVDGFVGETPTMQEAFNQIALAAASDACVLLQGESGTGKELAARAIHKHSYRADKPFVVINVAALSESLAESELFGHVRGAFTGAEQSRQGLLAHAAGGTLFLDEIADIPMPIQIKLLRALEQREVTPIGANDPIQTDFRIISATHQDLLTRVRQGSFRHDLYFRIATFCISLPPLRQRTDDIIPLSHFFLDALADANAAPFPLSAAAELELQRRPWHGNVRELRNAIEHAAILARGGTIMPEHLPPSAPSTVMPHLEEPVDLQAHIQMLLERWTEQQLTESDQTEQLHEALLALVEPPVLRSVVNHQAGQLAPAARILGLHRTTLRKKIDQYEDTERDGKQKGTNS